MAAVSGAVGLRSTLTSATSAAAAQPTVVSIKATYGFNTITRARLLTRRVGGDAGGMGKRLAHVRTRNNACQPVVRAVSGRNFSPQAAHIHDAFQRLSASSYLRRFG